MIEPITFAIICPLVFLAGLVDAIAGGGGLISLPAFLVAGIPPHQAIATNKLSSSMGTSVATFRFARAGYIKSKIALPCVVGALLGGSTGAELALLIPEGVFAWIMLVILPFVAFFVLRPHSLSVEGEDVPLRKTIVFGMLIAFAMGIYDGIYGPGTGTFLILLLNGLVHMKLTLANGTTKAINLATNVSALVMFLINGKVLILLGLVAGAFNIAGNYLGASLFSSRGITVVKPLMLVVLVIFFVKIAYDLIVG